MTARARPDAELLRLLERVRRRVLIRAALAGFGWSVAAGASLAALFLGIGAILGATPNPGTLLGLIGAVGLLGTGIAITRLTRGLSTERLALLVDEGAGLDHVATTLHTIQGSGSVIEAFRARARKALRPIDPANIVSLRPSRAWAFCVTGAVAVTTALVLVPLGSNVSPSLTPGAEPGSTPRAEAAAVGEGAVPTLGRVAFTITPPAYAELPPVQGAAGEPLAALPGSRIVVSGSGTVRPSEIVAAVVGGAPLSASARNGAWSVSWTVGPDDRGLALSVMQDGAVVDQRVLALRLLRDRPPAVRLEAPEEDLVLATPTGVVPIRAVATDDYGVRDVSLHWVRSRGSGESFDFDEGTWEWDRSVTEGESRRSFRSLDLGTLGLEPGDVVHVRATATDRNDVTGPGMGVSATRQIRVSREDDLSDVTTLVGFPIEREREPLLSQRMIILLTEELIDSAGVLESSEYLERASDIADEQARLRGRIGEQIFSRATGAMQDPEAHLDFEEGEAEVFLDELEAMAEQGPVIDPETGIASIANVDIPAHDHDSDPIVAINRSLLGIYNFMWDAERHLREAALRPSLVPQNLALDELQRIRDSERVFVRGRVTVAPIDVSAVRGTGDLEDATPGTRTAGPATGGTRARVGATLEAMLARDPIATGRSAAVEISGLALDLLESPGAPEPSEALGRAAAAARSGDAGTTSSELRTALRLLRAADSRVAAALPGRPHSLAAAAYGSASSVDGDSSAEPAPDAPPFVFATVQYASGDWDSAPLVPTNLIHSLAQYTDLPVAPQGVVVDLSTPAVFDHPFLYLTGHLPVFFSDAEARNLVDFVERGGLIFIDDHNHDIDGAFHRSVTTELARLFGADRLEPLPNDHELYSAFFQFDDGPPITGHELSGWGDGLIHRELQHIAVDGRIGVLYSNKDYSSEWSYHADNKRFLALDNTRFGVNILVYALTR